MIHTKFAPYAAVLFLLAGACDESDTETSPRGGDDVPGCDDVPELCPEPPDDDLEPPSGDDDGSATAGETADSGDDGDDTDGDDTDGDDTDGDDTDGDGGEADLPYDLEVSLGDTLSLDDAFLEKGPLPAAVLEVTMDGGDWRLAELQSGTPFVVTQDDCDHEGNRDVGRDRIFVTWQNADGSSETDHIDLRYCED